MFVRDIPPKFLDPLAVHLNYWSDQKKFVAKNGTDILHQDAKHVGNQTLHAGARGESLMLFIYITHYRT